MNQIRLSVNKNKLSVTADCFTTGGSVNYDECEFTFDSEWNGFTKTAVFSSNGNDSYRVNLVNNCCKIPSVCMENPGIIRIGVYGIKDEDIIITTNSVAHRIEDGVSEAGEWVDEDYNVIKNAITQMEDAVETFKRGLSHKFSELLKQVDNETEITFDGYLPEWYTPDEITDSDDAPSPANESIFYDYLEFKLEELKSDYPNYVGRQMIGYDETEDFAVFSYVFNPGDYVKTVVITSGVHGTDRSSVIALSYFLDKLCRNTDDKVLAYIRNNIKLCVIPVVNPYGLENNTENNSDDVNIGYNFPYKFSSCTHTKKGTSALNQAESQNVSSFLYGLRNDKLCALIDLHSNNLAVAGRTVFYPKNNKNCASILAEVVNDFGSKYSSSDTKSKSVLAASVNPTLSNYAAEEYKINTCELVWDDNIYSDDSDENFMRYVELIGNVLYKMALNSKCTKAEKPQAFTKYISWKKSNNTDVFAIAQSVTPQRMGISAYSMKLDMPCNIVMNGSVVIKATVACTVKINPILYQENSTEQDYTARSASDKFAIELELSQGTHIIPLSTVLQAYYSSHNESTNTAYCENVNFVLAFSSSAANSASVTAFNVVLNAFPSDRAVPVEVSTPMGLAADYDADDVPTQTLIFPLGTVSANDTHFRD